MATRQTSPSRLSTPPVSVSPAATRPASPEKKVSHVFPSNTARPFRRAAGTKANEILKDGYDHRKFLTLKFKSVADIGQLVSLSGKGVLNLADKKSESGAIVPNPLPDKKGSWLRLVTSFNRFGVDARVWGDGRFKLAIDAGYLNKGNDDLFGLFRANKDLTRWKAGLGLLHNLPDRGYITGRVRIDEAHNPLVDAKLLFAHRNIKFFDSFGINLANKVVFRNNAWISLAQPNYDLILSHDGLGKNLEQLGRIVFTVASKIDKYPVAAQIRYKAPGSQARFVLGGVFPLNGKTILKAKIDNRGKLSTQGKVKVNNNISVTASTQIRLQKGKDAFDFNKFLPVPLGFTIDATL